jgi:transposase-like protein
LTAVLSFILLFITIVVLYIVPQGRVAYWADWRLWGLTKEQWGSIHINVGLLFLLSIFLHIYYNWKALLTYLKNKARQLTVLTPEFNAALVLTVIFAAGTYFELAPFSWVLEFNAHLKDRAAAKYGEPPYGHAELSTLKAFASKAGLDLAGSLQRLKQANVVYENENQSLKDVARINDISPQQVFLAMRPAAERNPAKGLPPTPPPGTGNKTPADFSKEYRLDIQRILKGFSDNNVSASADMTIKQIARQNDMAPTDIYILLRQIATHQDDS